MDQGNRGGVSRLTKFEESDTLGQVRRMAITVPRTEAQVNELQQELDNKVAELLAKLEEAQAGSPPGVSPAGKSGPEVHPMDTPTREKQTEGAGDRGRDDLPDPWAGGKGAGKGGLEKDSEKLTNIYERKMFDKRVTKIAGEKGDKGEKDFKNWLFDVRKVTKDDPPFHEFLEWIADLQVEVTPALMLEKDEKMRGANPLWNLGWLNQQLYGIPSETSLGKVKETVMGREKEVETNGAQIFRDMSRDYLDSSQEGLLASGQRVVKPARATQENFEERLRA